MKLMTYLLLIVSITTATAYAASSKEDEQARRERQIQNRTPELNFDPEPPKNIIIQQGNYSQTAPTRIFSDKKIYKVSLYSKTHPLPLQKIHSWIVHVETADGKAVENATIFIHGGMPEHRHDFPVKPRVKKYLGKGDYLIKGIKFNMIGTWEMRIYIQEKARRDRAVFWFPVK